MARLCLKKPSKRMTCRKKYKIAKKIREHNRKKRKESKKLMNKPLKKLIHVPNICPFKEEVLKDVAEYKKNKEIEQQKNRKLILEALKAKKEAKSLEQIAVEAENKQIGVEEPKEDNEVSEYKDGGQHKSYYREFQKVVHSADVVLEVVDARDPLGTRCPAVEESVRQAGEGKRLVLVLNKAGMLVNPIHNKDLVPREILDKWIKYLRKFVPAIPFKSSTQHQNRKLGRRKLIKKQDVASNSVCVGAEGLTSLLANYTRNKGIKTSIRVGVVGLPNVGKSSLINSLKRSRACKVGAIPGITRSIQEIHLDSKIKLLDCPGLAMLKNTDPQAALKNVVSSSDSIQPAEMILSRASKETLMKLYLVPEFENCTQFLVSLAKRYGRYKRGGVADINSASKILVEDWNRGKIPYYAQPPEIENTHDISSSIVTSEVPEFDLDSYDKKVYFENQTDMDTSEPGTGVQEELVIAPKKTKTDKKKKVEEIVRKKEESLMQLEGNRKLNKIIKLKMKKQKKQKARVARAAEKLADTVSQVQL